MHTKYKFAPKNPTLCAQNADNMPFCGHQTRNSVQKMLNCHKILIYMPKILISPHKILICEH